MLSFLVSGTALLLALLGSVALVHPFQRGSSVTLRNFVADHHDHWVQVP